MESIHGAAGFNQSSQPEAWGERGERVIKGAAEMSLLLVASKLLLRHEEPLRWTSELCGRVGVGSSGTNIVLGLLSSFARCNYQSRQLLEVPVSSSRLETRIKESYSLERVLV